jgi:hypothetical protein
MGIKGEFGSNVQTIAEALAKHESAVQVSPVHVDRAFDALSVAGLMRRRWIDRPEAETAFGGILERVFKLRERIRIVTTPLLGVLRQGRRSRNDERALSQ